MVTPQERKVEEGEGRRPKKEGEGEEVILERETRIISGDTPV